MEAQSTKQLTCPSLAWSLVPRMYTWHPQQADLHRQNLGLCHRSCNTWLVCTGAQGEASIALQVKAWRRRCHRVLGEDRLLTHRCPLDLLFQRTLSKWLQLSACCHWLPWRQSPSCSLQCNSINDLTTSQIQVVFTTCYHLCSKKLEPPFARIATASSMHATMADAC